MTIFCESETGDGAPRPVSFAVQAWPEILTGREQPRFEALLPGMLKGQRWFGGKARPLTAMRLVDAMPIPGGAQEAVLLLIEASYKDGPEETYALPLTSVVGEAVREVEQQSPASIVARFTLDDGGTRRNGVLYDAMFSPAIAQAVVGAIGSEARFPGTRGALHGLPTSEYDAMVPREDDSRIRVMKAEQSNTSVAFGESAVFKLYRRVQAGMNPDWEIGRLLTSRSFPYSPTVGGALEYHWSGEPMTMGVLQAFVRNEGDAWSRTLTHLEQYFSSALNEPWIGDHDPADKQSLWELAGALCEDSAGAPLRPGLQTALDLGQRTAALHRTLGQACELPEFAPERLTADYCRARYESMAGLWKHAAQLLARRTVNEPAAQETVHRLLAREGDVLALFRAFLEIRDGGLRIRCHGDYHLGQILCTKSDYVITDFEGEPARPLAERRTKQSPLYDVAGMLRSFDYASWVGLARVQPVEIQRRLEPWAAHWSRWVRAAFLRAYVTDIQDAPFWPRAEQAREVLLTVHQLEKAVYELAYELNHRPDWIAIPSKGIIEILRTNRVRAVA
ncbi:MAG TPA: putative maltokinase [Nitrospira sp.]|nr:putative maltokinase [Nitrospira sp.]